MVGRIRQCKVGSVVQIDGVGFRVIRSGLAPGGGWPDVVVVPAVASDGK
jgi:hypothetical protein